ncbi:MULTISPECIES: lasso peptide biosynthesis B2 protein [Acidobacterium]|uniref:Conserved domain protein n=1 Tax=Acidobacterium capsulatum (strain ATCC 51196 / DSM 11244 / BCRC 80197 / JCM 7670 / NBRC 15755 / NCIMB 13165 / 161) TaxID=240015 RepID=C1F5P3_ACIC5|nr:MULTISPECIES: lasso peptide biosynthesis B2 protein [Acidobacterium]ACO31647.1 conserved domain protein [Acidobacterium capsulatum ATCC 51196]HCT60450.1 lasso peptide biosynthesis B2 protein [Acidobacterium sp.]
MAIRLMEAWALLLYFDCLMRFGNFEKLYAAVRSCPRRQSSHADLDALCRAMDLACVFYFKRVLCLQRSAATAVMFRRQGYAADLVIGVQLLPFYSHAWVECNGRVVNDRPYVRDKFQVLERC